MKRNTRTSSTKARQKGGGHFVLSEPSQLHLRHTLTNLGYGNTMFSSLSMAAPPIRPDWFNGIHLRPCVDYTQIENGRGAGVIRGGGRKNKQTMTRRRTVMGRKSRFVGQKM